MTEPRSCDTAWASIPMRPWPEQPDTVCDMVPVWSFAAIYDGPDGEVETPASYWGEDGVLDWCVQTKLKQPVTEAAKRKSARKFYWFGARHLDPRFRVTHRKAARDAPRPVSDTCGDAVKDWDHVMAFRDRILSENGLTTGAPHRDIAKAFAWELYANWRGGGARNHPADVLTHRSWCLGAANATVAVLESLGVPARGVAVSDHAMCEAFVDGAWRLIDSSNHFINHEPRSVPFLPTDYMWLSTDPCSPAHGAGISDYHRGFFYHFPSPHVGIPDGRWIRESLLEFCPACAKALYPNHPQYRFKTQDPARLVILERNYRLCHRRELAIDLLPGQQLRESVWIGETNDVVRFEFVLRFALSEKAHPDPNALKNLRLHVNAEAFRVAELIEWPDCAEPHWDDTLLVHVPLARDLFAANAVNWLQIENTGGGHFRVPLTLALLEPHIAPFLPA